MSLESLKNILMEVPIMKLFLNTTQHNTTQHNTLN